MELKYLTIFVCSFGPAILFLLIMVIVKLSNYLKIAKARKHGDIIKAAKAFIGWSIPFLAVLVAAFLLTLWEDSIRQVFSFKLFPVMILYIFVLFLTWNNAKKMNAKKLEEQNLNQERDEDNHSPEADKPRNEKAQ